MSQFYKDAGVDIEAGYQAVERMKKHVQKTYTKGVMNGLGSFGGLFDFKAYGYSDPILVSGTDGVGTKILLAQQFNQHHSIGIDCVAMCANDILAQGAKPLFFLDYLAVGKNQPEVIEEIVASVSAGCIQAGCALIGGETAEMAGLYQAEEYDLAGFCVGACNREDLMNVENTAAGQVLIGIASSGIHSNGYSLVRKVLFQDNQVDVNEMLDDKTILEHLLTPTKIYVKAVSAVMDKHSVQGIAHITGGGFFENIPRCLKPGLGAHIHKHQWMVPPIFKYIKKLGEIPCQEMHAVFNMGIGMVLVVEANEAQAVINTLHGEGETAWVIGEVVEGEGVIFQ